MALSPIIPTSFVPRQGTDSRRSHIDIGGIFGLFAYTVLVVVFVLAVWVFLYGRILAARESAKSTELEKIEKAIDPATVEEFARLHNRLSASKTLLANHPAPSGFFTLIENLTPSTVRFSSMHLAFDDGKEVKVEGTGTAKSFNALAAASSAFAADGRIKDVIFSNIVVSTKDNSVSFSISAALDSKLVAFSPGEFTEPASAFPL